jgi:DNA-binding NarL/FixJ family response regulator
MLTNRQAEVAMLIAEGLDNHIIARRLGITVATAWKHTESIAFKLGVYRRDALVQRLRDIAAGKARVE